MNYNKRVSHSNLAIIIVTSIFFVIGLALIIVANVAKLSAWIERFGIVILVISIPLMLWILYQLVIKKVKEM